MKSRIVSGARLDRWCAAAALAVSASLCSLSALANDWCEGRVTDTQRRVVQSLSRPAPLQSYTDPAFGTQVTRITNAPRGTARRTLYNTIQPWNADESLLMLYHVGGDDAGHHLYDGRTYRHIRSMEFLPADIEGIYWDPIDPDALFYIQRRPNDDPMLGNVVRYNVRNRTRSQVADLNAICGNPAERGGRFATGGNDIQGLGGDLIGLRCQNTAFNGNSSDITFTVNIRNGRISNRVTLDPTQAQGNNTFGYSPIIAAAPFPSGQRTLVQNTVHDSNMNYLYRLDSAFNNFTTGDGSSYQVPKPEHSTIGRMPDGNDALFSPQYNATEFGCNADSDFGRGAIVAYDIPNERCNVIVGRSTGWGYPLRGVHLSAVSAQNPGWVSMTTIGYGQFDYFNNREAAPVFFSELSLSHANPDNPRTCRLAHTRTYGKSARQAAPYKTAYFGEPHASMSPSGSRILFNSDWYDSGSVDTYVVTLNDTSSEPAAPVTAAPPPPEPASEPPQASPRPASEPEPVPESPAPQTEPEDTAEPARDPNTGYVFARTDKPEIRWISTNARGEVGSIWISETCAALLGGASVSGDWQRLMSIAPALDTVEYPCKPSSNAQESGYVYARTDKNELRWIASNSDGQRASVWISATCAQQLGGPTQRGDWLDLMARAPALDTINSPCL